MDSVVLTKNAVVHISRMRDDITFEIARDPDYIQIKVKLCELPALINSLQTVVYRLAAIHECAPRAYGKES